MRAVGVGNGPRNHIDEQLRQNVLDAAAILQLHRSRVAAAIAQRLSGPPSGGVRTPIDEVDADLVGAGYEAVDSWMNEAVLSWRELLSVRPTATLPQLRVSVPYNRKLIASGLKMISLFDQDGTEREARELLAREERGSYLFAFTAVQMKIVDRRFVLLQGPPVDGHPSVMRVRDHAVMAAAWRYWHAVVATSFQGNEAGDPTSSADKPTSQGDVAADAGGLSSRQWRIVTLLATDTRDEAIAEALGVSVRTVRADIADMLRTLGVRTRFAAGLRLGYALSPGETAVPGFTDVAEDATLPQPRTGIEGPDRGGED